MRSNEVEALGRLAGDGLSAASGLIREMHAGIASRPFGSLGPPALPVRLVHDSVSATVYGAVAAGLRLGVGAAAGLARRSSDTLTTALGDEPRGALALAILNGFYGDLLERQGSPLTLPMTLRGRGGDVALGKAELTDAYPEAAPRVAVFIHGLCETDRAWWLLRGDRPSYGDRLHEQLGITPVYVRYNTGRRVSDNGRSLAALLEELSDLWPVPVRELILVGHSMGGLVARSACRHGELQEMGFTRQVRHVFSLGTPHLGADLEKGANALAWALRHLPETRALATALNSRSTGIKDLRYGALVEEDWRDHDPDEFLRDRCGEVPFLPAATYYFVGATLRDGPLGRLLGDLLVRAPSASGRGNGRGRRIPFEVDCGLELSGLTHFDLLNHPAVYGQLRGWLERAAGSELPAAPPSR